MYRTGGDPFISANSHRCVIKPLFLQCILCFTQNQINVVVLKVDVNRLAPLICAKCYFLAPLAPFAKPSVNPAKCTCKLNKTLNRQTRLISKLLTCLEEVLLDHSKIHSLASAVEQNYSVGSVHLKHSEMYKIFKICIFKTITEEKSNNKI